MNAAPPLLFPGNPVLAQWWQKLESRRPEAFWIARILLHHVEALVAARTVGPLDALEAVFLRVLGQSTPESAVADPERGLPLGPPLSNRVLERLHVQGLIKHDALTWRLTALGQEALEHSRREQIAVQRRSFHFVAPEGGKDQARLPHFLGLRGTTCVPARPSANWWFDPNWLVECVRQPRQWKDRDGFPEDVLAVALPLAQAGGAAGLEMRAFTSVAPWRRVIFDRAECLVAAILKLPHGGPQAGLLGFEVDAGTWNLMSSEPAFFVAENAGLLLPQVRETCDPEEWNRALREWLLDQGCSEVQTWECSARLDGACLHVDARALLPLQRGQIQATLSRGDIWLSVGDAEARRFARLVLGSEAADR